MTFLEEIPETHVFSIIVRTAVAASLRETMWSRLSVISGHPSRYAQDMVTWFEGVLLVVKTVGSNCNQRSPVLWKLGISSKGAWITFNSMFKESWGKKEPTLGKAKYKRELVEAKLRHIQQTP